MKESGGHGFRVDSLTPSAAGESGKCGCAGCGWSGKEADLKPIVGCSLAAGQRVPAGRCPKCGSLVEAGADDDDVRQALDLMERLVSMDEMLRKGKSLGGDDYGSTLKAAKKAVKRALARFRLSPAVSPGAEAESSPDQ